VGKSRDAPFAWNWKPPAYFGCIGLGYIIVETVLIQRFVLLLEHPAYAAAAVVAGMLISSGVGSYLWERYHGHQLMTVAIVTIAVGLLIHGVAGGWIIHAAVGLPMLWKCIIAALLVLPLGIAMGIPLPAGMTSRSVTGPTVAAWCWGVNGSASIVASPVSVIIAMGWGFSAAVLIALGFYVLAFVIFNSLHSAQSGENYIADAEK